MDQSASKPLQTRSLQHHPGWANHTQQDTPLLDKVCGEVTVTDPGHALYGQTLPLLPVRIHRKPRQVMVLLPSGRRQMVPQAATNLERSEEVSSPAPPSPSISVRTLLPLARLVQQRKQAKEERHAEQTASSIHPTEHCSLSSSDDLSSASPEPPTEHLAHLVADLMRRLDAGKQNREGDQERCVTASSADY